MCDILMHAGASSSSARGRAEEAAEVSGVSPTSEAASGPTFKEGEDEEKGEDEEEGEEEEEEGEEEDEGEEESEEEDNDDDDFGDSPAVKRSRAAPSPVSEECLSVSTRSDL